MTDPENRCPYCAGSGVTKVATTDTRTGQTVIERRACGMCGGTGKSK
jgi:transcriptional regulator NrdR family protein